MGHDEPDLSYSVTIRGGSGRLEWHQKEWKADFIGGTVVKNPPAKGARRHGFDPCSEKILHAVEQLTCTLTTAEPVL